MSQLNELLERVSDIQRTISITVPANFTYDGPTTVTDAFPYPAADPSQANAPFFYNEYKGAVEVKVAAVGGQYQVNNQIDMVLCFTNINAESRMENIYAGVAFWRDAVLAAFAAHLRLGNDLPYILDARVTKVGPFEEVNTAGETVWGSMTFTLIVRELYAVPIAG